VDLGKAPYLRDDQSRQMLACWRMQWGSGAVGAVGQRLSRQLTQWVRPIAARSKPAHAVGMRQTSKWRRPLNL